MRVLILAVLIGLLPVSRCMSQDGAKLPEKAADEPDHLVPLDPFPARWHRKYSKLYREKLELPKKREATVMLYMPSFSGEESLIIQESKGTLPSFKLIHTRADRNIWYSMAEHSEDGKPKQVVVTHRESYLPRELGERVCRIWDRMLREVRYPLPDEERAIADGEIIEFWHHRMYGTTHSPEGGAAKGFVDLGRSLIDYCATPEEKRAEALKKIETRCQLLERHLDQKAAVPRPVPAVPPK